MILLAFLILAITPCCSAATMPYYQAGVVRSGPMQRQSPSAERLGMDDVPGDVSDDDQDDKVGDFMAYADDLSDADRLSRTDEQLKRKMARHYRNLYMRKLQNIVRNFQTLHTLTPLSRHHSQTATRVEDEESSADEINLIIPKRLKKRARRPRVIYVRSKQEYHQPRTSHVDYQPRASSAVYVPFRDVRQSLRPLQHRKRPRHGFVLVEEDQ